MLQITLWACWYVAIFAASSITLINLYLIAAAIVTLRPQPTLIPMLAGLVAALAFRISPMHSLQQLWWLPIIADPAGLVFVLAEMVRMQFVRFSSRSIYSFGFHASAYQAFNPPRVISRPRVA